MSKKQTRGVRWLRVIMWAFLGFMYTVLGTQSFVIGELGGLAFGLLRFYAELRGGIRDTDESRHFREWQTVALSFLGFVIALATRSSLDYGLITRATGLLVPVFAAVVAYLNVIWQRRPLKEVPETVKRPMSKKLAAHYEAAGLSDSEIDMFRETMATASKNVHQLESTVQGVLELQDIMAENDTMNIIHAYFKAIVDEPKRMTEAAPFLYEQLPNMADLTHKYAIINRHEVKTEDTYLVLSQAKDALRKLAETIKNEYTDFVRSDIDDLDTTVSLTKRQLLAKEKPIVTPPADSDTDVEKEDHDER
ncbi:5-bromo-4-chloroindolyl phosphate hydrolysis family protein [Lacticaseibacillus zhaodongensis]|uniref:5-bromo-4-chloroindolyl phosphate hydrolysis family protein n=1 Tax=Lacticaseibacillus zhaodongensis TaxID=2668065 RepID=UPI0012D30255|nr:5-bromo-4-chloroindolyl phosphate hydrolysis family protein [Lacticaseibacillus zhaodongensis]